MSVTADRTLSTCFSNSNSGEWTPITTNPCCWYFSAQARTYGSVRRQLMHVYVQKSTRTTFPRRADAVSGDELSQAFACWSEPNCDSAMPWAASGPCKNGACTGVDIVG